MGPPRHLALLPEGAGQRIEWPVPFADGVAQLLGLRGRRVVMLTSGDPFWFGAGSVVTQQLQPQEWRALPGVSAFSLAAAQLGWAVQDVICLGLHAAPLTRLRPHLSPGVRSIVLLRDGDAVKGLARWLGELGFGKTVLHVMEALGGPRARVRQAVAGSFDLEDIAHPVCIGLEVAGDGMVMGASSGRADDLFDNDGQITKRPVRALTLSALGPRAGEHLWDIGGGSGSIAIEWLLSESSTSATTVEPRADRAARIRVNADTLGVDRLQVVTGSAPEVLAGLAEPDAVFIGGGLSQEMLVWLFDNLRSGTRLVANAVTLESAALLSRWYGDKGGDLMRVELAHAGPLGGKHSWKPVLPIVQWSVTL